MSNGSKNIESVDVVVVGGGPGGSTASTLLAKSGRRVVQLEKETFPRYQIGESLLPSTIHGVCKLIGAYDKVKAAGFTHKEGGSFRWGTNPVPWNFNFAISPEFAGEGSHAFQVERMKFDQILLENAAEHGVDVRQNARATGVIQNESGRVTGVRYVDADRVEHNIEAAYVIDASGNSTRLSKFAGGERVYSDFFQNVALFGYFENGKRLPAPSSGNILCAAFDEGWCWYIPLSDTLTSVGVVLSRDKIEQGLNAQESTLLAYLDRCEIVRDMLTDATRVTDGVYGEIRLRQDYSYSNTKFSGNGMVLVGDAACFIDPVFSTGVHLTTYAGVLAARSINSVLDGVVDEERAFGEYEGRYRREYSVFYEFLSAFYDMDQGEDSYFWKARKVTNLSHTDIASFVSLVAGGASGEQVLTDPSSLIDRYHSSAEELTAAAARTGDYDTDKGRRMGHLFGTRVVRDVMEEMNALQARSAAGEASVEPPILENGLVPSADGLSWVEPIGVTAGESV